MQMRVKVRALAAGALLLLSAASVSSQTAVETQRNGRAVNLDKLIEQREYPELERLLPGATLDETSRAYFEGIVANRRNDLERSIALLVPIITKLKSTEKERAAVALRTLADDYVKSFRYADADHAYGELLADYKQQFPQADRQSLEDDASVDRLLKDAPPQTLVLQGDFSLPTHRSKLGTIDADLTVNGVTKSWILDTGANYSVVTESLARQLGLKLSKETAQTQGSSGAENLLHTALIPEIQIGTATVQNIVVLVLAEKALKISVPSLEYQIDAILGYPVLSALGRLTFTSDNRLLVGKGGDPSGAKLYMQQLNPLLDCQSGGRDLLLMFDSGASNTTLTAKYRRAFPGQFTGLETHSHAIGGAGGIKRMSAYTLPEFKFTLGGQSVMLRDVTVASEPLGTDFDLLYGTFGRDLVAPYKSFTLDFKAMRFRLDK